MDVSAGLLMYRIKNNKLEYFLAKAGGPYFQNKPRAWSIPKGHVDEHETIIDAAIREFSEETSIPIMSDNFIYLPPVYNKHNKKVIIYAFRQNYDIKNKPIKSNLIRLEYPKQSGHYIEVPEMECGDFFTFDEAIKIIFKYQIPLLEFMESEFKMKKIF